MYAFFNPMQLKHTNIMSPAKKFSHEVVLQLNAVADIMGGCRAC